MDLREIDKRVATELLDYNLGKSFPKHYSSNLNQTFDLLNKLVKTRKISDWVLSNEDGLLPLEFTFKCKSNIKTTNLGGQPNTYDTFWTETDYNSLAVDICNLLLNKLT